MDFWRGLALSQTWGAVRNGPKALQSWRGQGIWKAPIPGKGSSTCRDSQPRGGSQGCISERRALLQTAVLNLVLLLSLGLLLPHSSRAFFPLSKAVLLQRQEVWSRLPQHKGWWSKAQSLRCSLSAPALCFALGSHFQECFSLPRCFTGKGQKYLVSKHHEDYTNAVALAEKSVWTA